MGKGDSAMYYYNKAHDVNPKNPDALSQIGDYYLTEGNAIGEDMNKLGNSADEVKKYNELKAKRKAIYMQAKPYFEQAQKIDPDDAQIKRILVRLEALTAE
jgi:tetratricopeptide (TPR) repeat protein